MDKTGTQDLLHDVATRARRLVESGERDIRVHFAWDDEIFEAGVDYLQQASRNRVFIYAPTGVWIQNAAKRKWFKVLAGCLARQRGKLHHPGADMSAGTTVDDFIGVYGLPVLPPPEEAIDPESYRKQQGVFSNKLDQIQRLLAPFSGLPNAKLYYLPMYHYSTPGTGMILIDDTALALGFAVSRINKVDFALLILDERDLIGQVSEWFEHHVLPSAVLHPIQDIRHDFNPSTVSEGMNRIRVDQYRLPLRVGRRARSDADGAA